MSYVALTRVSTIIPILDFVERIGIPRAELLRAAELPSWITANTEALIPADSPMRLFGAASERAEIPHLALSAGERAPLDRFGMFGQLIRRTSTLGAALDAVLRFQTMLTSGRRSTLRSRGDQVEFCMRVDHLEPRDFRWQQDNQFSLALMMAVVRYALGPSWCPREVHLQTDEAPGVRDAESLVGTRIAFRQPEIMIAIPRAELATRLPPSAGQEIPMNAVAEWTSSAPAHDFAGSVGQAVDTLSCGDSYPTIRETADFLRMSVRTLQRRLANAGLRHDVLVARARYTTATAVLEATDAKILDLALDLGYSDHANFTRAFRRWAGCSPQEYRARHRLHLEAAPAGVGSAGWNRRALTALSARPRREKTTWRNIA